MSSDGAVFLFMRDIICIGASAGGVEALSSVVRGFVPHLRASVLVVLHIPPEHPSLLGEILDRAGPLRAKVARDGEGFLHSRIYVAPPDHHLIIDGTVLRVIKGPKENRFRPAIDPLFRSAAEQCAERAIGVLLSGALDDGTAGLWALKRSGGLAVTQDLTDALFPEMPRNATRYVEIDHTATAAAMGALLNDLVAATPPTIEVPSEVSELTRIENAYVRQQLVPRHLMDTIGTLTSLICPMCNGPLWRIKTGPTRFRCANGHAFTPTTLIDEHRDRAEHTLSILMTLFDDEVALSEQVLETCTDPDLARQMTRDLQESRRRATALRGLLPAGDAPKPTPHPSP